MSLAPGTAIGFYEIAAKIGSGGMGDVYRARDSRLEREVALKVIRHALHDQPDTVDRFLREAMLVSSLNHPNIVTIYETGVHGADRYIAMEMVAGRTLRHVMTDEGEIEIGIGRVCAIAHQTAQALAVAHAARIIHRDIKPENVMVRPDGYVKVLDFGLARFQADAASHATGRLPAASTTSGIVMGTIGYLSPEQVRGEPLTPACDVFALGIVLYELLAGRHPFDAPSVPAQLHALVWDAVEPPSAWNPDVPPALDRLVLDALQKTPLSRPPASELAERLMALSPRGIGAAPAPSPQPSPPSGARECTGNPLAPPAPPARGVCALGWGLAGRGQSEGYGGAPSTLAKSIGPIVGRDTEIDILRHELGLVRGGAGRIVVISGEAGIGKTTLVETFLAGLARKSAPVRIGRGRCSERLAGSEAYLPVLEVLDNLQHDPLLGGLSRLTRTIAPSWYLQIAPASRYGSSGARLVAEASTGSQERLKREIGAFIEEAARHHPLIIAIDDVQWADPSTTDLMGYLARRIETLRVLIVVTARASELAQTRHPFLTLKLDLIARGLCREVTPGSLDEAAIARYLALHFPRHAFPGELAQVIHRRTEGHPLFMADAIRDLLRRGVLRECDGDGGASRGVSRGGGGDGDKRWMLTASVTEVERELPESIRSLVERKMAALDDEDRQLLGAASVQGVDFDTAALFGATTAGASASPKLTEEEVERRCDRLEREHALIRLVSEWEYPDRTLTLKYRFAHHVYHHACYESLRITRRVALSRVVAGVLVERMADRADEKAAELALLFETAREYQQAAAYFHRAALAAARKHAHDETRQLAERGLAALQREQKPHSPAPLPRRGVCILPGSASDPSPKSEGSRVPDGSRLPDGTRTSDGTRASDGARTSDRARTSDESHGVDPSQSAARLQGIALEVDLLMTLGLAIKTAQGYAAPEVHQAYARARELCRELDDPVRVVPILIALAAHYAGAGEIEASRDIGIEMLKMFEHGGSPHLEMLGEWALGAALFHLGELPEAHRHISRALELYDPAFHEPRVWDTGIEPGIFCRCELARIQTLRGAPDDGLTTVRQAVAQARALGHPQPLAFSLLFASFIRHERREWTEMARVLDEMIALCTAKGIAQELLWAEPLAGLAAFELAPAGSSARDAALERMEAGLAAMARRHSAILRPFYLHAHAGMLMQAGRLDDAEAALREAQESAARTRQHAYDADLHRLRAELRAMRGGAADAERGLRE